MTKIHKVKGINGLQGAVWLGSSSRWHSYSTVNPPLDNSTAAVALYSGEVSRGWVGDGDGMEMLLRQWVSPAEGLRGMEGSGKEKHEVQVVAASYGLTVL